MNSGHGGNVNILAQRAGLTPGELLDFSANINPLGPPENLRSLVNGCLSSVIHYPDPGAEGLVEALAAHHGIPAEQIVAGNGSTELFYALPRILGVARAVIPVPSYADYAAAAGREGLDIVTVPLNETDDFALDWSVVEEHLQGKEMLLIGQPNNPTGRICAIDDIVRTADRFPDTVIVVDEAFSDFIHGYTSVVHRRRPNIIVMRSMTKFYAIPGLRLGYALAPLRWAEALREYLPPWTVGTLAQRVGAAVLDDHAYAEATRQTVTGLRQELMNALGRMPGIKVYDGRANFLLLKLLHTDKNAVRLEADLLSRGIAVRLCTNFEGLDDRFIRIAVRSSRENERLVHELDRVLNPAQTVAFAKTRRNPAIMFLGTSSNAGKSVLTAAMGRILLQDGYSVAPFKAQNMSLNSHVTADGGEMGRAQVVQAQACRLAPDVRMNPVLLKPNSDMGSQVIVMGKPVGNMEVSDYINYKGRVFETVCRAYDSLASEMDVVVLEGAGSPAEVNLKSHDIVNLAMAEYAGAATMLVGDIDRGGVFASFAGTMDLLSERERALISGYVINRFRGKAELLKDAIDITFRHTGLPTFGVVPYIPDLGLPEEDSVSFKAGDTFAAAGNRGQGRAEMVDIAIVDLPHISNFTDFDALAMEPDVRLRIVRRAADLGQPDVVMLPGSKNTIDDLAHIQRMGLTDGILALARGGKAEVVGICGGFQMICRRIEDPHAIESRAGGIEGLGLLDAVTTMAQEKSLHQVGGRHTASGMAVKGYEIHHGETTSDNLSPSVVRNDGDTIGLASLNGRIWGTYLHGIFDDDDFRRWYIDRQRVQKALAPVGRVLVTYDVDAALDRLADVVRNNLQISKIYRKAGLA